KPLPRRNDASKIAAIATPRFPHHRDCEGLTGITLDHLPRDGSLGRIVRYAKGRQLWQSDDAADRIYFLRLGRVAVMTAEHRPVLLRTIEADQTFGELCLCATGTRTRGNTASALIACEVIEIKPSHFLGYLRRNPQALDALLYTFCLRLTDAEHRVGVLSHRGAEQRLGRLMLRLGTSGGRIDRRDTVTLSVSHNELAQMAGMNRSHVTVTMGRLRRRGLVRYRREGPLRVDVQALTAYLGSIMRGEE
ncbi:MAG TPA: Crp/Fnr family transcriptional regulator, partial [Candidatus Dormibacteraeota bacterium]